MRYWKRDEEELPRGGNLYPYAGMIRVRFNGYDLSLLYTTQTPLKDFGAKLNGFYGK